MKKNNKKDDVVWTRDTYPTNKCLTAIVLKDAIEVLQQALADETSGKWKDLYLETDDSSIVFIKGERPETEKERTERLNSIQKQKEYRQKMYEQLKKEFED